MICVLLLLLFENLQGVKCYWPLNQPLYRVIHIIHIYNITNETYVMEMELLSQKKIHLLKFHSIL